MATRGHKLPDLPDSRPVIGRNFLSLRLLTGVNTKSWPITEIAIPSEIKRDIRRITENQRTYTRRALQNSVVADKNSGGDAKYY